KQATRFAAVCKILPDGEGVLIAPRWVLTAAHVATGAPRERLRAQLLGVEYRVAEVIAYPDWRPGKTDLALMRLAAPVQQVAPLELSNADLAVGTEVLLAGRGDYGDGQRGVVGNDGKLRVANNAVSKIEPERLFIRLDAPEDGALDAEGVSGPGDSGTPALVERDGRLEVVGIGSVGVSPKPRPYGEYGSQDVFIRTSHFAEWILEEQSR
ncbi:MAG: trypsin-like serine protease, partial [Actinobacteria bacterium]|nr:trypsin-like serine protease [Actinomycetota bacterium]